jgi:hypothetical protein
MRHRPPYDQQLRAIGQSLEAKRIQVFELKKNGSSYIVRGQPEAGLSLIARLRDWRGKQKSAAMTPMTYSLADIERLERLGRAQRRKGDGLPDFYNVSNTLRTVGYYLNSKGAELLEIQKKPLSLTLLYRDHEGHPRFEERAIVSFYKLFLELHAKRRKTDKQP